MILFLWWKLLASWLCILSSAGMDWKAYTFGNNIKLEDVVNYNLNETKKTKIMNKSIAKTKWEKNHSIPGHGHTCHAERKNTHVCEKLLQTKEKQSNLTWKKYRNYTRKSENTLKNNDFVDLNLFVSLHF